MKRSALIPISLIVAVDVLGLTLVIPLLPFYAERYGASPSVVGLLVSAYAACQLISGPLLGALFLGLLQTAFFLLRLLLPVEVDVQRGLFFRHGVSEFETFDRRL